MHGSGRGPSCLLGLCIMPAGSLLPSNLARVQDRARLELQQCKKREKAEGQIEQRKSKKKRDTKGPGPTAKVQEAIGSARGGCGDDAMDMDLAEPGLSTYSATTTELLHYTECNIAHFLAMFHQAIVSVAVQEKRFPLGDWELMEALTLFDPNSMKYLTQQRYNVPHGHIVVLGATTSHCDFAPRVSTSASWQRQMYS